MSFLPRRRKPFASPASAILWLHARRMAVLFPLMTFVIFLPYILQACWESWIRSPSILLDLVSRNAWVCDLAPYYVLCGAAALCGLRLGTTPMIGVDRKLRFPLTLPVSATQAAQGRLIGDALVLLPALLVAACISTVYLFTVENGLVRQLAVYGLTTGAATIREIASWVFGVPLAFGIAAWGCLGLAYRPFRRLVVYSCAFYAICKIGYHRDFLFFSERPACLVAWFIVVSISVMAVSACFARQFPFRTLLLSAILWVGATFFLYPARPFLAEGAVLPVDVLVLFAAAAGVLPMPIIAAHLDANRLRHGRYQAENPKQNRLSSANRSWLARWIPRAAAIAAAVFIAWFRWPAEPTAKAYRGTSGFPTTFDEINALSPPVPDQENIALKYLAAYDRYDDKLRAWGEGLPGERQPLNGPHTMLDSVPYEIARHLLFVGFADTEEDSPIPVETWRWSKELWERVGKATLDDLRLIPDTETSRSRYRCDQGLWGQYENEYSPALSCLSSLLRLGTVVTSAEHDSEQASQCVLATIALARSLDTDLRWDGQLRHGVLCANAVHYLKMAMNKTAFSDAQMQRLQESISRTLSGWPRRNSLDIPLHAQALKAAQAMDCPVHLQNRYDCHERERWQEYHPDRALTNFLWDIQACERIGILALVQGETNLLKWSQTTDRTGHVHLKELQTLSWLKFVEPRNEHSPPSFREPEPSRLFGETSSCIGILDIVCRWDCSFRTNLSLAPVALGVERFRLATGHLPERLDELLPRFLDSIPEDPWDYGHPVLYCAEANGAFAVFTAGWEDRNKPPGDLSGARFEVRNPEFRNRLQVAPADSPANASKTSS